MYIDLLIYTILKNFYGVTRRHAIARDTKKRQNWENIK